MKMLPEEPSYSMQTEGRTNVMKVIVAFRNFAKAPKIGECNAE
jgi:hypothetical protein